MFRIINFSYNKFTFIWYIHIHKKGVEIHPKCFVKDLKKDMIQYINLLSSRIYKKLCVLKKKVLGFLNSINTNTSLKLIKKNYYRFFNIFIKRMINFDKELVKFKRYSIHLEKRSHKNSLFLNSLESFFESKNIGGLLYPDVLKILEGFLSKRHVNSILNNSLLMSIYYLFFVSLYDNFRFLVYIFFINNIKYGYSRSLKTYLFFKKNFFFFIKLLSIFLFFLILKAFYVNNDVFIFSFTRDYLYWCYPLFYFLKFWGYVLDNEPFSVFFWHFFIVWSEWLEHHYLLSLVSNNFVFSYYFLVRGFLFILIFLLFLYVRSSIPRYKLVNFQNKYWKQMIIFCFIYLIVFIYIGSTCY